MHDFQGYFSRTSQDQSDFPGLSRSWNFQEKIQDFRADVGTLYMELALEPEVKMVVLWLHADFLRRLPGTQCELHTAATVPSICINYCS